VRSALLLAAFDSQLKWCMSWRAALEGAQFDIRIVVPDTRSAISERQRRDAGVDALEYLPWDEMVALALTQDVVVNALNGPLVRRLTSDLAARRPEPGPVVVTGWVGVVIEKVVAGYLDRCGADVVVVNGTSELSQYRNAARHLGLADDNLLLANMPFLSAHPAPQAEHPIGSLLFADQPTVPAARGERLYVYERVLAYARRHPDRQVFLKPRHERGEDTFHRMRHHPEELLHGHDLPPNFAFVHAPIVDLLAEVDVLITMSSTACLEAVDRGLRVALLLDLGVHERYGNHVFLESGLLRTFDQIEADDLGTPSAPWVDSYFSHSAQSAPELVIRRVLELIESGQRPSHAVWASEYFTATTATARVLRPGQARSTRRARLVARLTRAGQRAQRFADLRHRILN
jgi:hypothetical protein